MMKELPIPSCPITKFSNENPRITSHILTMKYKWELGHSSNKVSSEKKKGWGEEGTFRNEFYFYSLKNRGH